MSTRDKRVLVFGIGLLIISAYLGITSASPHLLTATQWQQTRTCGIMWICYNYTIIEGANQLPYVLGNMTISSKDAFYESNTVYYQINVTGVNRNMKQAYFIIGFSTESFNEFQNMTSVDKIIKQAKLENKLIDLHNTSKNHFYREGHFNHAYTDEILMKGLFVFENGDYLSSPVTDLDIKLNLLQTGIQAKQSDNTQLTNEILLGLTWLGVSLAPALLGADMILRVIFEGNTKWSDIHPIRIIRLQIILFRLSLRNMFRRNSE